MLPETSKDSDVAQFAPHIIVSDDIIITSLFTSCDLSLDRRPLNAVSV